ncbi:MAG: AlbA family DNA-binding domain-containing protein, partial [Ignavibacteria bacterium]
MHLFELHELIENGENGRVEFKRKFTSPEKIAKEMIAFANTKGGKILFGVDDNRSVIGVESEKGEIELIETAAKYYCIPEVKYKYEILHIYRKDVIIVEINESYNKPHRLLDNHRNGDSIFPKVYIRIKDKSVLASKETIRILKKTLPDSAPLVLSFGDNEKTLLDYLSMNQYITLKSFKKLVNISER